MSWTQSDLDQLDASIKRGVKSVTYQSGSVTYHSLGEMLRLRDAMKAEIAGAAAPSRTVAQYDNGLNGPARSH